MGTNFSISDMYDEALKRIGAKRAEGSADASAAFAKLGADTDAAYTRLNNEAYVNKALSERANGTAGDRIATLKQRSETNLKNTLGKNTRQLGRATESARLARESAITRQAADDAATAATYGAAESAAQLSQLNFDKELGLKQKQLEMDTQQRLYERAYKMYAGGMIGDTEFKTLTGIEVKKRRTYQKKATASQITDAGTIKPELSSDYVVYTTRDKDGATHYWKVSATLAKDASDKGISLYSGTALKTEAQLYAEVYYEGYYGASGEEQSAILEANQDDFVAHFGINYFTLYSNFVETFSGLQGTHVPEMEPVLDILRNFNKYASTDEDGVQGVFDDYSAACKTVLQSVADEYTGGIGWEYVEECFPEVAELFEYTNSDDDIKREWLGIAPASFTPEALAGALQKTWDEEKQFASATLDSAPMEREAMLEEMGVDLSELSAYEILCVAAYIDSVVDPETSSPDGIPVVFREHGTMQALVSEGEQIYGAYTTWNYENIIAKKDSLPSVFVDEYMATQAEAGQVWDKLSLKEQSDFVLDMYAVYQEYNLPDEARGGGGGRSFTGSIFSTQTEKDAYTAWKERTGYKPEGRMSVPEEFYESEEYKNALQQDAETSYDNYIAATDAAAAGMLSEEDAQQVSELESSVNQSAVSYLDDLSSLFGTNVYGDTSTLSQDVNSAIDLLLQSYGATYGTNVYGATVGYIDVNSELGQVLTAAIADGADIMAATENGYAIYAGEAEILLKYLAKKFDSAINGTGWKFTEMNGWDYLTHGGFTLTQDLIRNLLSGKKEAAELTDADNAFLTAIGRIVYVNSYVLTEQFKADAQFISTFEAAMQQISGSIGTTIVKPLDFISETLGLTTGSSTITDYFQELHDEGVNLLPYTENYTPTVGALVGAGESVADMATDMLIGMGISSAIGAVSEALGTAAFSTPGILGTSEGLLANEALGYTGAAEKLLANDMLKGTFVTQFAESYEKYSGELSSIDAMVTAMVESIGMTYIEGLGGVGAASGESLAAGLSKVKGSMLKKIFSGITGYGTQALEELSEEAVQALFQSGLEGITTGQFDMSGSMEQFSLENAGTTAISIAAATLIFYLIGLPVEISNMKIQERGQKLLNDIASAIENNDIAELKRLGIEASNLVSDILTFSQISAEDAQNLKLLTDQLDIAAQGVQTTNGEILVPEISEIDSIQPLTTAEQLESAVQASIEENIQTNPEGVQMALTEGITTLTNIESRIKADSGNINHEGIGIDAIHDTYMNYARGEIGIRSIAPAMAENIKTIMQTQTLTEVETAQLMGVLEEIVGDAGLAEAYVSSAIDGQAESGYNDTKDIQNFKFNKYLRKEVGDPPADMVNPHAHHILFKEGLGPAQKALVKEGQALLRRYGIDPIWGLENLVWAPNRIVGQHDIEALRKVVEKLKLVEDFGGSYNDIVEALEVLGEIAAERRK